MFWVIPRRIVCAVVAGVALAAGLAHDSRAGDADSGATGVRVESGMLAGKAGDGVAMFLGIPYAAPPTGDLRWRPPAAALSWTGARQADDYGASCLQSEPPRNARFGSRGQTMSEDCLTLNIWTPLARPGPLPVMVWLHGGGNVRGTGADRYYDGSAFARDGVVLVTLNYRLGALGFFAHRAIMGEAGNDSGNFGLLDQIAALRWIRSNIAAFGGDPSNVTIFGESAGGEDAVILAASAAANKLFGKVIAESAGDLWGEWATTAQARNASAELATKLGLPGDAATAGQLRALPADAFAGLQDDDQLGLTVDGRIISARLTAQGLRGIRVPIVIGTNDGDDSLGANIMHPENVWPQLSKDDLAFVRARYAVSGITNDAAVAQHLFGDGYFAAPARWVAKRLAEEKKPVYLYRFDYVLGSLAERSPAAPHGSEIPFVFENWPPIFVSDADRSVGAAVHDCWIAFARTGTPECPAVPAWPPYDARSGRVMLFDAHPSLRDTGDIEVLKRLEERLGRASS